MKNHMLLYMLIVSLSSFNYWPMQSQISPDKKKLEISKTAAPITNMKDHTPARKIKYYHVLETVPLKFGGYTSEYDVTNPNIINTYDLGPNGTRVITAIYEDEVQIQHDEPALKPDTIMNIKKSASIAISDAPKEVQIQHDEPALKPDTIMNIKKSASIAISDAPKRENSVAYINILKTYERVSDKGYESVEMLKKLGNSYFFNDEFEKAEKCYSKLFSITTNLEPDFYYRYSIVLKAMGNIQKSEEFLKKFNQLSSVTSRQ